MTDQTETNAPGVLERVQALVPEIAGRAGETEAARRLPAGLLDELRESGCFRVLLPPTHGGLGAPLATALDVYDAVAQGDASTAWCVAIGAGAWLDLTGLPRATFDELFDRPGRIIAGTLSPGGTATETTQGYRIDGRWAFASGCVYADWIYGVTRAADDPAELRTVLFSPDQVDVEDTWHAAGMRGTASHHFRANGVVVAAGRTFPTFGARPAVDVPITRIPLPSLYAVGFAAVALGAARGALDHVLALATDKVPLFDSRTLAANRHFQHQLAQADAALRAARCLVWDCAEELWATAEASTAFPDGLVARSRGAAAWATATAADAATVAFRLAGGTAVYTDNPLQRRLRDVQVIAQHFLLKPDTLTNVGAAMAGQSLDVPFL